MPISFFNDKVYKTIAERKQIEDSKQGELTRVLAVQIANTFKIFETQVKCVMSDGVLPEEWVYQPSPFGGDEFIIKMKSGYFAPSGKFKDLNFVFELNQDKPTVRIGLDPILLTATLPYVEEVSVVEGFFSRSGFKICASTSLMKE